MNHDGAGARFLDTSLPTPTGQFDPYAPGKTDGLGNTYPTQTLERATARASTSTSDPTHAVKSDHQQDLLGNLDRRCPGQDPDAAHEL